MNTSNNSCNNNKQNSMYCIIKLFFIIFFQFKSCNRIQKSIHIVKTEKKNQKKYLFSIQQLDASVSVCLKIFVKPKAKFSSKITFRNIKMSFIASDMHTHTDIIRQNQVNSIVKYVQGRKCMRMWLYSVLNVLQFNEFV